MVSFVESLAEHRVLGIIRGTSGEHAAAADLLARALGRHGRDPWLRADLAACCQRCSPPRDEEAARHLMAALGALTPAVVGTALASKFAGVTAVWLIMAWRIRRRAVAN